MVDVMTMIWGESTTSSPPVGLGRISHAFPTLVIQPSNRCSSEGSERTSPSRCICTAELLADPARRNESRINLLSSAPSITPLIGLAAANVATTHTATAARIILLGIINHTVGPPSCQQADGGTQ
eukprot:m.413811 g.413811  ORF g.413811 m.413811 type:complete len:125 (+) comp29177_c0_seq1:1329-1703(+)